MDFDNWKFLASSAAFGAAAGAIRAFRNGLTIRRALIEALTAFVLCVAAGSALMYYTTVSVHLTFGICGLIGLTSEQVLAGVEKLWAAVFKRAESAIGSAETEPKNEPVEDEENG
ncbi:MAG: hypothetical protein LCH81_03640 [Bacteroidetes bacterium]|nr:hypothetical protein [Bacteroidota bacterium]